MVLITIPACLLRFIASCPEPFSCPLFTGYGIADDVSLIASLLLLTFALLPLTASAWNIPGHMLSGAIAYQVLQQENPQTIEKVKAVLEKHPSYQNQWQARLQDAPVADHALMLFMQASRWADDARIRNKQTIAVLGAARKELI
jgi:hypothetical protein